MSGRPAAAPDTAFRREHGIVKRCGAATVIVVSAPVRNAARNLAAACAFAADRNAVPRSGKTAGRNLAAGWADAPDTAAGCRRNEHQAGTPGRSGAVSHPSGSGRARCAFTNITDTHGIVSRLGDHSGSNRGLTSQT